MRRLTNAYVLAWVELIICAMGLFGATVATLLSCQSVASSDDDNGPMLLCAAVIAACAALVIFYLCLIAYINKCINDKRPPSVVLAYVLFVKLDVVLGVWFFLSIHEFVEEARIHAAIAEIEIPPKPLGMCEVCKNLIYDKDDYHRVQSRKVRPDGSVVSKETHVYCRACYLEHKTAKRRGAPKA